jgi:hypothetical protein
MIAQARLAESFDALAQPNPRVFLELADVFLDHDRNEKFHRLEADAIHLRRGTEHGVGLHAERPKALLSVAQGGVDEVNVRHGEQIQLECWSDGELECWD